MSDSSYKRFRVKDSRELLKGAVVADVFSRADCSQPTVWTNYANSPQNFYVGSYTTFEDTVVRGFHKRKEAGEVFYNPMTRHICILDRGSGFVAGIRQNATTCSAPYTPYNMEFRYGCGGGNPGLQTSSFTIPLDSGGRLILPSSVIGGTEWGDLMTEASTKVQANRGKSDANLFESLAELNKAAGILPSLLGSSLKTLTKKGIIEKAQNTGNGYLVYRYGIKPILSDVKAVLEGLKKATGKIRETTRGKAAMEKINTFVRADQNFYGGILYDKNYRTQETVVVRATSLDEYDATLGFNMGFSLKGALGVPWELVPYSFVVDWFATLGDYLNSHLPAIGFDQLCSGYTIEQSIIENYSISNARAISGYTLTGPLTGNNTRVWNIKTRIPGLPAAGVVIRSNFKLSNLTRSADLVSLILQKIKIK